MKVVSQEVSTSMTSVAVIHAEEAAPWPFLVLPRLRLEDVEYDAHPIFVIVPDNPLISIGSIGTYNAILPHGALGGLIIGDDDAVALLQLNPLFFVFIVEDDLLQVFVLGARRFEFLRIGLVCEPLGQGSSVGLHLAAGHGCSLSAVGDRNLKVVPLAHKAHILLFGLSLRFFAFLGQWGGIGAFGHGRQLLLEMAVLALPGGSLDFS